MMINSTIQRDVTVKKDELLEKLRENRKQHIDVYNETVENYLKEAERQLDEEYEKAKEKLEDTYDRTKNELENFDPTMAKDTIVFCEPISFTLKAPRSYENEYNRAIEMLYWEQEEEVKLNPNEFRYFVMDDWDWTIEFTTITGFYNN